MESGDIRARVVSLERADLDHEHRIKSLEVWQQKKETMDDRREASWDKSLNDLGDRLSKMEVNVVEKFTSLAVKFTSTKEDISAIKSIVGRVAFLIVAGFIISILTIIWKGGGHVPLPH